MSTPAKIRLDWNLPKQEPVTVTWTPYSNDEGLTAESLADTYEKMFDTAGVLGDDAKKWIAISRECGKLIRKLKLPSGRNFYALRHTFQTVGDQTGLYVVVKSIMAHAESDGDMSANYRENVSDENMQSVVDHVHAWLYGGSHE